MARSCFTTMVLVVMLVVSACGSARVVWRDQGAGEVALEGDRRKATDEAYRLMQDHCRGEYQILEEGEVVVGTDTVQSNESHATADGRVVEKRSTSTHDSTEWRIKYRCVNTGTPAPRPE